MPCLHLKILPFSAEICGLYLRWVFETDAAVSAITYTIFQCKSLVKNFEYLERFFFYHVCAFFFFFPPRKVSLVCCWILSLFAFLWAELTIKDESISRLRNQDILTASTSSISNLPDYKKRVLIHE